MATHLDRARWLRDARAFLAEDIGAPPEGAVTVIVRDEAGNETTVTLQGPPAPGADSRPALSPLERRIVEAVREAGVLTAKRIAARIRVSNDGGFRAILSNLCEREPPALTSGHDGYRLSGVSG